MVLNPKGLAFMSAVLLMRDQSVSQPLGTGQPLPLIMHEGEVGSGGSGGNWAVARSGRSTSAVVEGFMLVRWRWR